MIRLEKVYGSDSTYNRAYVFSDDVVLLGRNNDYMEYPQGPSCLIKTSDGELIKSYGITDQERDERFFDEPHIACVVDYKKGNKKDIVEKQITNEITCAINDLFGPAKYCPDFTLEFCFGLLKPCFEVKPTLKEARLMIAARLFNRNKQKDRYRILVEFFHPLINLGCCYGYAREIALLFSNPLLTNEQVLSLALEKLHVDWECHQQESLIAKQAIALPPPQL